MLVRGGDNLKHKNDLYDAWVPFMILYYNEVVLRWSVNLVLKMDLLILPNELTLVKLLLDALS